MSKLVVLLGAMVALACSGPERGDDAGAVDSGGADAGRSDASRVDSGRSDAGPSDAGPSDAGANDAGSSDAGSNDAGPSDGSTAPPDASFGPIPAPPYTFISETGGYDDLASGTLHSHAIEFTPRHTLWTDGASKRRWILFPPGTTIDTSDPDRWIVPVGTRVFKEFSLPGGRLETRLIQRVADRGWSSDWWLGAFVWNVSRTEATYTESGMSNVLGTGHDVPSARDCQTCHEGESGRVLGFSTIQLSGASPFSLADLIARGLASHPPAPSPVPGDAVASAAAGYLHANCGHCHNPRGDAWRDTDMILRISAGESVLTSTALYRTTVGVRTDSFRSYDRRIVAGDPDQSAVHYRMSVRGGSGWGGGDPMPPLGTEIVDTTGLAAVRAWISAL